MQRSSIHGPPWLVMWVPPVIQSFRLCASGETKSVFHSAGRSFVFTYIWFEGNYLLSVGSLSWLLSSILLGPSPTLSANKKQTYFEWKENSLRSSLTSVCPFCHWHSSHHTCTNLPLVGCCDKSICASFNNLSKLQMRRRELIKDALWVHHSTWHQCPVDSVLNFVTANSESIKLKEN